MPRTHWRTSELLAQGWRPADLISFLSQRPDIRLDGEGAYTVHRVDMALAKSVKLRAQIVAHVEPAQGEWLFTVAAIAAANGIGETSAKRRLGEPATFRIRKNGPGYWAGYTRAQIMAAGLRVPDRKVLTR